MKDRLPLTGLAQGKWQGFLKPGDWAIDATAGNGLDTAFIAQKVGSGGRVFAIDVQESAIRATADRLDRENLLSQVSLIRGDHARLNDLLPCGVRGRIQLVCFNLGYLPNGNHAITTQPDSTIAALHASLLMLAPEGRLSVIAYRGHAGALEEAERVENFFKKLPHPWTCLEHLPTGSPGNPGPVWWLAGQNAE